MQVDDLVVRVAIYAMPGVAISLGLHVHFRRMKKRIEKSSIDELHAVIKTKKDVVEKFGAYEALIERGEDLSILMPYLVESCLKGWVMERSLAWSFLQEHFSSLVQDINFNRLFPSQLAKEQLRSLAASF